MFPARALLVPLSVAVVVASSLAIARADAVESAPAQPAAVTASLDPVIGVDGTAAQEALVAEAVAAFLDLALALPDLDVTFWVDESACDGALGMFRPRDDGWRIDVCSDLPFVVPHEIAHAWERVSLDDADRAEYIAHRGLSHWTHPDRAEAGIEDLAHVVQLAVQGGGDTGRPDIDEAFAVALELSSAG